MLRTVLLMQAIMMLALKEVYNMKDKNIPKLIALIGRILAVVSSVVAFIMDVAKDNRSVV